MVSPISMDAVNAECGIESERETEELIEQTEAHAGAPFQNSPEREREKKRAHENDDGHGRPLRFEQRGKHEGTRLAGANQNSNVQIRNPKQCSKHESGMT